jgi:hypothetical protein
MTSVRGKVDGVYVPPRCVPPFLRWFMRPVGWPLTAAAVIATLISLYGVSVPGFYMPVTLVGMAAWLAIAGCYFVRLVVRTVLVLCVKDPMETLWARWWRWFYVPLLALGTQLLASNGVPARMCFELSRPSMERLAREVATTPGPYADRRVGWYSAAHIERITGGMRFIVSGSGSIGVGAEGFARLDLPPSEPIVDGWYYRCYQGDWYCTGGRVRRVSP